MAVIISTGESSFVDVDIPSVDVELDGGDLHMQQVDCDGVTITDGTLEVHDSNTGDITMASLSGNSLIGSNTQSNDVSLTGGISSQRVSLKKFTIRAGGLSSSGVFGQWSADVEIFDDFDAAPAIDLTDLTGFALKAEISNAQQHGILATRCASGSIQADIVDAGQGTDNTYDGFNFVDCDDLRVDGSAHSAVDGVNDIRYGWVADTDCTGLHIDVEVYGAQTGEYLNNAGLEVSLTPRFSAETPVDGDMAVWDNAAGLWRPESAVGS